MDNSRISNFFSTMLVVASLSASPDGESGRWKDVADAMVRESPRDTVSLFVKNSVDSIETFEALRKHKPRYVAFVIRPEELNDKTIKRLKRMMCQIDSDPYEDAIWGIVTGPTAKDAMRVATSKEPRTISSILATTGVGKDLVKGPVAVISDANPPGEWWIKDSSGKVSRGKTDGDTSHLFAEVWRKSDPELLVTSSHASERNLEMPFSRGNIVAYDGKFGAVKNLQMIDYSTGQAKVKKIDGASVAALAAPRREKVWIAPGNCLIANHKPGDDMIMTALGFGRVNQFVGYIKTTWYGEIGWNTWRYFGSYKYPLNESWYAANQLLIKKLESKMEMQPRDRSGLIWDFDGTVFYGNPRRAVSLEGDGPAVASKKGDLPLLIVFPEAKNGRKLVSAPKGFKVFVADDFAFVEEWPDLKAGWKKTLKFD